MNSDLLKRAGWVTPAIQGVRLKLGCGRGVDPSSLACCRRYRFSKLSKCFDVAPYGFLDIEFGLSEGFASRNTAREVRHVCGPVRRGLFEHYCVFHASFLSLRPAALSTDFNVPARTSSPRRPGIVVTLGFDGV